MTEGAIVVLSVSSLFVTRVGVYYYYTVGVGVCNARTHTHCTYGVLGCEPRGRDDKTGGPKESRWTKSRHKCIQVCVQSIYVYIYARRRDES